MNKLALYTFVLLLVIGCGEEKDTKQKKPTETPYELKYTTEIADLLVKCKEVKFPYVTDTTLLDSVATFDSLSGNEVKWLYTAIDTNSLVGEVEYELKSFFEIDSIKKVGAYTEWANSRDIGQMKYAKAYVMHKLHLNDSTDIITWAVTYATYEACPYSGGSVVFASVFYDGKISCCLLIGEDMAAGDPPVGMSRIVTSLMDQKGNLTIHWLQQETDEGEDGPINEKREKKFDWLIRKGHIINRNK